jgi:pyruvate kinase
MRKTKIICTIGPAVDDEELLKGLIKKGMNVARMNFSHGSHEEHQGRLDRVRKVIKELDKNVAILLDTKGPEIRTGKFESKEVILEEGQTFILVNDEIIGDKTRCTVSYKNLYQDVKKGTSILMNDGLIELKVEQIKGKDIYCTVMNGGVLGNNKNMNVPNAEIMLPALTERDISDLQFAVENNYDFIAASFIRKASDVLEIKKVLEKAGDSDIKVIAKIENRQGIDNIDEIIKVADGVMVARGDLGNEIPVEEVPVVQKMIINKCNLAGKPAITATQMLDSMIRNPRPTRAEASDVANAIFDGTSAIMLSGETANGKYPVEAVETMARIAQKAENSIEYWKRYHTSDFQLQPSITNAISHATCTTAMDLRASAIVTVTESGHTARMISRFRPACPIIATTSNPKVQRQMALVWGVSAYLVEAAKNSDELFDVSIKTAEEAGVAKTGDLFVITGGSPIGVSGTTNLLKVHVVGNVLVRGTGVGNGYKTGEVFVAKATKDAFKTFEEGKILVVNSTSNDMLPYIKMASALIVEEGGLSSHAATVGLALGIPVLVGAENATQLLKTGVVVTLDAERGIVYYGESRK